MPDIKKAGLDAWHKTLDGLHLDRNSIKPPFFGMDDDEYGYGEFKAKLGLKRPRGFNDCLREYDALLELMDTKTAVCIVSAFDLYNIIADAGIFVYPNTLKSKFLESILIHESLHNLLFTSHPMHYMIFHNAIMPHVKTNYAVTNDVLVNALEVKILGTEQVLEKMHAIAGIIKSNVTYDGLTRVSKAIEDIDVFKQPAEAYRRVVETRIAIDGENFTPADLGIMPEDDMKTFPFDRFYRRVYDGSWEEHKYNE